MFRNSNRVFFLFSNASNKKFFIRKNYGGIKIPSEVLATKFNFVKRINFSCNDGTVNSFLPEVASLTFTYIETIGFVEVMSLITSGSCKTRGEVCVSIHRKNPKVQDFSTEIFTFKIISDGAIVERIAADISPSISTSSFSRTTAKAHLDTRTNSGFHVLQW